MMPANGEHWRKAGGVNRLTCGAGRFGVNSAFRVPDQNQKCWIKPALAS
jgi:hypothetical protein